MPCFIPNKGTHGGLIFIVSLVEVGGVNGGEESIHTSTQICGLGS